MKRCKICRKKPRIERRVNSKGVLFCSDDCYEEYEDLHDDMDHPYIDDYEAVRFEYIEWMKRYEDDLYKYWLYGFPRKKDLIEKIDDLIDEFYDYYRLEGADGVFSEEIYNYLLAIEELKEVIAEWEADAKELKKRRKELERKRREALLDE
ncbi:hypothetical protein [Bacillus marinisedimentorum]|uniref:hypothetical protein n=1 Tax=Bacillus marinisedimentorum TaxID=1821260 RepID=UPI0007DF02EE|nr:hypothetical protein [Bacillus marinisedimentorum]